MPVAHRIAPCLWLALLCGASFVPARSSEPVPDEWLTPAEIAGFESTPSYDETLEFLRRLAARAPEIRVDRFGESASGRPLPLVIVSKDLTLTPRSAADGSRAVVLIQSGIHGGEIDGKDATLLLLRDLALGRHRELLDGLVLLFVPIYNVDGHERVSIYNRPNQNGPVRGMGFRTTADGHDLNRDHLKLSTPEARAMAHLFDEWRPHLHVDNHVTDGVDHDWVLTYAWAEAPQVAPEIDTWLSDHMPSVLGATRQAGHRLGPYVSLRDREDPAKGFDSNVGEPRYATGYYPLRNRPSILVENHAYKPYRDRVLANRDFMIALLEEIAAAPSELIRAVAASEARTVARGRPHAAPSTVVVRYRRQASKETILFPVYDWYSEPSVVYGGPMTHFRRGQVREIEVPWIHRVEPELTLPRPRGYFILPGWPAIERRLRDHGLVVRRVKEATTLEVETIRVSNAQRDQRAAPSYQGLTPVSVEVRRTPETRSLPEGTLWIPADQPDFELAVQLLEPEAPDSLLAWGLLSTVLERKEYIDPRVLEGLVAGMLEDPATAAAWQAALGDPGFAADRNARYLWWYRRTPYWDETIGLMPVMRLMRPEVPETVEW